MVNGPAMLIIFFLLDAPASGELRLIESLHFSKLNGVFPAAQLPYSQHLLEDKNTILVCGTQLRFIFLVPFVVES